MLSTHSSASRAWSRVLKRSSPIAPITVRCSPRLTCARSPSASMRRQTSSISASPIPGFSTMIISIPSRRSEPGARPKKQKGPRAAGPSARGPWFVRFALRHGAAGQTVAKVVAEEARPARVPRPHGARTVGLPAPCQEPVFWPERWPDQRPPRAPRGSTGDRSPPPRPGRPRAQRTASPPCTADRSCRARASRCLARPAPAGVRRRRHGGSRPRPPAALPAASARPTVRQGPSRPATRPLGWGPTADRPGSPTHSENQGTAQRIARSRSREAVAGARRAGVRGPRRPRQRPARRRSASQASQGTEGRPSVAARTRGPWKSEPPVGTRPELPAEAEELRRLLRRVLGVVALDAVEEPRGGELADHPLGVLVESRMRHDGQSAGPADDLARLPRQRPSGVPTYAGLPAARKRSKASRTVPT